MKHSYASLFCLLTLALALPVTEANGQIRQTKGTITVIAVDKESTAVAIAIGIKKEELYYLNKDKVDYVDQNGKPRSKADLRLGREVEIEWKKVNEGLVAQKIVFHLPSSVPPIPTVVELVGARRDLVDNQLFGENRWWNKLILERFSFQGSFGRGLTLSDVRGRELTVTRTDNFTAAYSVTLSIPFSAFSGKVFVDRKNQKNLTDEEITIRELYSNFSKAKDAYLNCLTETGCRDSGYEMQKHALELLVRAGMEQTADFDQWQKFLP
ncbi:hypothetical protein MYX77_04380 [Acidobacteriia bacterium AH_259_A11_L15]|nr:hypothetical protein [Acidobacteriia bacterium AH_259_A11_L15]